MRIIILTAFFAIALAVKEESVSEKDEPKEVLQSIPTTYEFKYSTGQEGPAQLFREEFRDHDGTVKGKYGYVDPNGKLRVVNYRAGANGYSASGDIGTDGVAQDQARQFQSNDPSVRAQADWGRTNTGGAGYGTSGWNSPPSGWSSVDPLWNVGALPQSPGTSQIPQTRGPNVPPQYDAQPRPLSPASQTRPLPPDASYDPQRRPSPVPSQGSQWDDRSQNRWDDRAQNQWDSNTGNNWQKSQQNSGNVDWNTWNSDQQTWSKQTGQSGEVGNLGGGGGHQWSNNVDHQWNKPQGIAQVNPGQPQTSPQWQTRPASPQQPSSLDQWEPPSSGPTSGRWSSSPQSPTAGQWSQYDDSPVQSDWSAPRQPPPPSSQSGLTDLKRKWTGVQSDDQTLPQPNPAPQQWDDRPLAGPPSARPIPPQKPLPAPPGQSQYTPPLQPQHAGQSPNWNVGAPPPVSIADQWSQRQPQPAQPQVGAQVSGGAEWSGGAGGVIGTNQYGPVDEKRSPAPSGVSYRQTIEHDARSAPPQQVQWAQSPDNVNRIGSAAPAPVPTIPKEPVPNWSQPASNAQYIPLQTKPAIASTANTGSGQQWPNPPLHTGDMFSGPAFVRFRIDHTVDPNQPPLRYQYSY